MSITAHCRCGTTWKVADSRAGQSVQCPDCGESSRVGAVLDQPESAGRLPTFSFAITQVLLVVIALIAAFAGVNSADPTDRGAAWTCFTVAVAGLAAGNRPK